MTVARHEPVASGSVAAIAEMPPTLRLEPGHATTIVRYVEPDHAAEISIAPAPVNAYTPELCRGGSRTPGMLWGEVWAAGCPGDGGAVVWVVTGTLAMVVVVAGVGTLGAEPDADAGGGAESPGDVAALDADSDGAEPDEDVDVDFEVGPLPDNAPLGACEAVPS